MDSINQKNVEIARVLRKRQTLAEETLWEQLRGRRLAGFKFRRQFPILKYVVDFYCMQVNLVIEVDGSIHDNQQEKDYYRQEAITTKSGASFLRFSNEEVLYNMDTVLEKMKAFLAELLKRRNSSK
ncbi:MAG: DUF559 domain-containing protein [Fibrobacteria bacterium]|nr:DUF559 domain-containing protein [Fibrobacteria bacterium]